jgi:hypothetical protein
MPTVNPRVNVTLSPALDALVTRLAVHRNVSKSQVLRELLEAAEPALQRAVALMDAASRAAPEVLSGLADSMLRAQERIEDVLAGSLGRVEQADLVRNAQAVRGRRRPAPGGATEERQPAPAGASRGANPPSSNRGVRSTAGGPGKPGKSPRRGS